jgi:uncharacterized protein YgbK (DUF1537 family)
MAERRLLNSFYGDDFTGTMATAENFMLAGIPAVVFTKAPSIELVKRSFPAIQAVGIAGIARTLNVQQLEGELVPVYESMRSYGALSYLYKVCSTFDSSPEVGNIGRAAELGVEAFDPEFVSVLPAAPRLGRYLLFGNLYAAVARKRVYRLDRHPSLPYHPVTPMKEADMLIHLAAQTDLSSTLVTILDVAGGVTGIAAGLDRARSGGQRAKHPRLVFFDCLTAEQLDWICEAILQESRPPAFFVGAHEVPCGLAEAFRARGLVRADSNIILSTEAGRNQNPIFVASGSCADITGQQILWAGKNGFDTVAVRTERLLDKEQSEGEIRRVIEAAALSLDKGRPVIAHTAIGSKDDRAARVRSRAEELKLSPESASGRIGDALGRVAEEVFRRSKIRRLVVAGGDTAGKVQSHLAVEALQIAASLPDPAPLSYVYSGIPEVNGIEMAFKGGQVGKEDYFQTMQSLDVVPFADAALGALEAADHE